MGANSKDECPGESYDAIRCAKAAMLLLSLGSSQDQQEKEMMNQTIEELRIQLVKERFKRKNLKLCNLMELAIQIMLLFSLCAFFLVVLAFKSG